MTTIPSSLDSRKHEVGYSLRNRNEYDDPAQDVSQSIFLLLHVAAVRRRWWCGASAEPSIRQPLSRLAAEALSCCGFTAPRSQRGSSSSSRSPRWCAYTK